MKQKAKSQSIKKKKKENHLGVIEWKAGAPSNDFSGDKSAGRVWGPQQILAVWHVPCEGSSLSLSPCWWDPTHVKAAYKATLIVPRTCSESRYS